MSLRANGFSMCLLRHLDNSCQATLTTQSKDIILAISPATTKAENKSKPCANWRLDSGVA